MKRFIIGCLAGIGLSVSYYEGFRAQKDERVFATTSPSTKVDLSIMPLSEGVSDLDLKKRYGLIEPKSKSSADAKYSASLSKSIKPDAELFAAYHANNLLITEKLKKMDELSAANPSASLPSLISDQFESEIVDYDWASQYEVKINEFFNSSPELSNFRPTAIECKSTRCRASISIVDEEHGQDLSNKILDRLRSNSSGIKSSTLVTQESDRGELNIYFNKE